MEIPINQPTIRNVGMAMHNVNNLEKSKKELIKDILVDIKQNP